MIQTDLGEMVVSHEQQCLDAEELAWLAGFIARETGLKPIAPDTIIKAYGTCDMPLVTETAKGRLWIDRYYIAYEGKKRRIHYAYLTREHVREEWRAYSDASAERKRVIQMPKIISHIFHHAVREMNGNHVNIWFEKPDVINIARRVHYAYQV